MEGLGIEKAAECGSERFGRCPEEFKDVLNFGKQENC